MRIIFVLLGAAALPGWGAARYSTTSDWGAGFCGQIVVTNDASTTLTDWTLEFDFDREFSSMWEGSVQSRAGSHYVVKPPSYTSQLAPNAATTIGFCGLPGNVTTGPTNLTLNGVRSQPVPATPSTPYPPTAGAATVTVRTTGQWSGGFGGEINLLNSTTQTISGWRLSFTLDSTIESLWNGSLTSANGTYTVTNEAWNGTIAPGASIQIGFMGTGTLTRVGNCALNGSPCGISFQATAGSVGVGGSSVVIASADTPTPANQLSIRQGVATFALRATNVTNPVFRVTANNPRVVRASINGANLNLTGLSAGRSGLRIEETTSGAVRYVGVRVLNADGSVPAMPRYLSLGMVSEDIDDHLAFWRSFDTGAKSRFVDIRYIYLNGGPFIGWNTWGNGNGQRLIDYIRNSKQLGMIPYFVWYNIPAGGESYATNLQNIQNQDYMKAYFRNLKLALDLIVQESPDEIVGMVLEPDFLGYLAQNSPLPPGLISAYTQAAYDSGVLQSGVDMYYPNNVQGLVQAINYTIRKYAPKVWFGWQVNLWASPANGFTTSIPGKGLIQKTQGSGLVAGRAAIAREAAAIAAYYVNAGIASNGAKFVAMDKYGLDAAGYELSAAADPGNSTWFWNNDLWGNYLTFTRALWQTTGLPVVPWQVPTGHINTTRETNPYDLSGLFADLTNSTNRYEDSAGTFFFGDTFVTTGQRLSYFSANQAFDPSLRVNGSTVTWGPHMLDAASHGIISILFGPGVGISTSSIGTNPGDRFWWITKAQKYLANPVLLP